MSKRTVIVVQKFDSEILAEVAEGERIPAAAVDALLKGDAVLMAEFDGQWREFTPAA